MCAQGCFDQITPLQYGPWISRGAALGFGVDADDGRCYCQNDDYESCASTDYDYYDQYTYITLAMCNGSPPAYGSILGR